MIAPDGKPTASSNLAEPGVDSVYTAPMRAAGGS